MKKSGAKELVEVIIIRKILQEKYRGQYYDATVMNVGRNVTLLKSYMQGIGRSMPKL